MKTRIFYTPKASEYLKGKPPGEYSLKLMDSKIQPNGDLYNTYGLPDEPFPILQDPSMDNQIEALSRDPEIVAKAKNPRQLLQTFTIVHMSTSHKKLAMGVSIIRRQPSLECALQQLSVDSQNHGEQFVPLAAFLGEHPNILPGSQNVKETTRPSEQIIRGTSRDIPKSP